MDLWQHCERRSVLTLLMPAVASDPLDMRKMMALFLYVFVAKRRGIELGLSFVLFLTKGKRSKRLHHIQQTNGIGLFPFSETDQQTTHQIHQNGAETRASFTL